MSNDSEYLNEDKLLRDLGEFIDEDAALMGPTAEDLIVPLEPTFQEHQLDRSIGLWSGMWIIVASSVGSGIFASPGIVFGYTSSVGASLLIWVLAGLLSITGALCYAELGAMMPVSGGEFTYLLRAYGSLPAFLFSFANILLSRPASTAILSLTFAQYLAKLFDSSNPILIDFIAIFAIISICFINIISTKVAVYAQGISCLLLLIDFLAVLKLLGLFIISMFGIFYMFTVNH